MYDIQRLHSNCKQFLEYAQFQKNASSEIVAKSKTNNEVILASDNMIDDIDIEDDFFEIVAESNTSNEANNEVVLASDNRIDVIDIKYDSLDIVAESHTSNGAVFTSNNTIIEGGRQVQSGNSLAFK